MSYYNAFPKQQKKYFSSLSDKEKLINFVNALVRMNLNNCLTLLQSQHPQQPFLVDFSNKNDCKKDKHIFETTVISHPNHRNFFTKKIHVKDFFVKFNSNSSKYTRFDDGNEYNGYFLTDNRNGREFLSLLEHYHIDSELYKYLIIYDSYFISFITNYKIVLNVLDKMLQFENITKSDENKLLRIKFYCESLNGDDLRIIFLNKKKHNHKLEKALIIANSFSENNNYNFDLDRETLINKLDMLNNIGYKMTSENVIPLNIQEFNEPQSKAFQDNMKLFNNTRKNSIASSRSRHSFNSLKSLKSNISNDEDFGEWERNQNSSSNSLGGRKHRRTSKRKNRRHIIK